MPAAEDAVRQRLTDTLADLRDSRMADGEAMFYLGNLASRLLKDSRAASWEALKNGLTDPARDSLLQSFERQGNGLAAEGRERAAYAIHVLALSLVASMLDDESIATGARLLDEIIARAIEVYRSRTGDA